MANDREKEIHSQPPECGNCGEFFIWMEYPSGTHAGWAANCKCSELTDDGDEHVPPWEG